MQKIKFAKGWADVFADLDLQSFDDFFNYNDGQIINRNSRRNVTFMRLGEEASQQEFFMKRFINPHFKDVLSTWFNFGSLCSQAACEWNNANILLKNGVDTYRPVCFGEETKFGLEHKSFFVTEKIQGKCLTDYITENWPKISTQQKENIMTSLAKVIRTLHTARISLPDLYTWHVFISEDKGKYNFAIIDLHRMRINTHGRREYIRNLGAFEYSILDSHFDEHLKQTFRDAYAGDDFSSDKEAFFRKVKKRADLISRRRKKPVY